jgi:hypothetical protein
VPKLPVVDDLHNQGTLTFPKWLITKNPHMNHDKFRALKKCFQDFKNIFGAVNKFPNMVRKFWGASQSSQDNLKLSGQARKHLGQLYIYLGTHVDVLGTSNAVGINNIIFRASKYISAHNIFFRGQLFLSSEYFPT